MNRIDISKIAAISPDDAKSAGLMQLTPADGATHLVETVNGQVTFREWCAREVARVRQVPNRRAELVKYGDGRYSVWVNRIAPD